jgi:hypothetical protein
VANVKGVLKVFLVHTCAHHPKPRSRFAAIHRSARPGWLNTWVPIVIVGPKAGSYSAFDAAAKICKRIDGTSPVSTLWTLAIVVVRLTCQSCSYPSPAKSSSIPPIIVQKDQVVTAGSRKIILRPGTYAAVYQEDDGVYYRSPMSMEQTDRLGLLPMSNPLFLHGGVFIPNPTNKDQRQAIWAYAQRAYLGKLVQSRPLNVSKIDEMVVAQSGSPNATPSGNAR